MQPGRAQTSGLGVPLLPLAPLVSLVAPVCPTHGVLVSFLSLVRPMCARCPGPLGSCSPVCSHGLLCRVCGVLGHLAPVHCCARSVWCVARAVSQAPWLPFTGVPAQCVVLRVWCPGPLGSCSPVRLLRVLLCVRGVLGHLARVHRCACSVFCFVCAVSWATWLLFTGVPARFVVLCLRCPGPLGSCSPVCPLGVLCCVCGVWGPSAPAHRCARSVCCVVSAVSWATWLLFTAVPAQCGALRVRCPRPLGSRSPVCPLSVLCCVCGVLGHLALVRRCACSVCCFACAVSWVTWLVFTGVPALSFVLFVRCPGPLGSCSPVCPRGLLCCVCGVLGHLAPVHRCVRSVYCVVCVASGAPRPPLTGVPARCVVLRVRCPGPLGSCSPVRSVDVLYCVRGVPGLLALVHRCARPWCLIPLLPSVHERSRCSGPRRARSAVCALCAVCMCYRWLCPSSSPPNFQFFFFCWKKKRQTWARVHCRHRHGQLVRRCNSVVSSAVCRRCSGGSRAPGVRLARPDVHGYGPGWVWLGVSLLLELAG